MGFSIVQLEKPCKGFFIKAFTSQPALGDGRIQVGDRIISVNDVRVTEMNMKEVLDVLRTAGPKVLLVMFRPPVEWADENNNNEVEK